MTSTDDSLRRALLLANPRLSKFDPLPRILSFTDFDDGYGGWNTLVGNHDGDLSKMGALKRDLRGGQLSTANFFDIGSHGSMDGAYSLKLATRANSGSWSTAMKRLTLRRVGVVQFETYFCFKAEQIYDPAHPGQYEPLVVNGRAFDGNFSPSEQHFGFFTLLSDIWGGSDDRRFLPALRYLNTDRSGQLQKKWMYKTRHGGTTRDYLRDPTKNAQTDLDAPSFDDWAAVPGGHSPLCYNETATKLNWHYLRWQIDIGAARGVELQVNDTVMDLREIPVPLSDHYDSLNYLLNFRIDVHTYLPVRNLLFMDSAVISADW